MSLIKLSVENLEGNDKYLHEIDMKQSLEENIKSVCRLFQKPYVVNRYILKILSTNDDAIVGTNISNDNFNEIKDGYVLKLDYSLDYYIELIFKHIDDDEGTQSFKYLYNLSVDPEFIQKLAKTDKHQLLINHVTTKEIKNGELTACLMAIAKLAHFGFPNDITPEFLKKVISLIKQPSEAEQTICAFSILYQILVHSNSSFVKWKEEIIEQLPATYIIPFIRRKDSKDLEFGAILLINALMMCCKGDKRQQIIKLIEELEKETAGNRTVFF